jgi:hypothetical protein
VRCRPVWPIMVLALVIGFTVGGLSVGALLVGPGGFPTSVRRAHSFVGRASLSRTYWALRGFGELPVAASEVDHDVGRSDIVEEGDSAGGPEGGHHHVGDGLTANPVQV